MSQKKDKKGIRWKLFNLFGPPDLKNLVDGIDELTSDGSDIVIFPTGQFPFAVKTSNGMDMEPLLFETEVERASFLQGLNYGVSIMGGSTTNLTQEEFDTIDIMEKKTTHGGGGGRLN